MKCDIYDSNHRYVAATCVAIFRVMRA